MIEDYNSRHERDYDRSTRNHNEEVKNIGDRYPAYDRDFSYGRPRSSYLHHEESKSISPIKRVNDYPESRTYQVAEKYGNSGDLWREKEIQLGELSSNRLNSRYLEDQGR